MRWISLKKRWADWKYHRRLRRIAIDQARREVLVKWHEWYAWYPVKAYLNETHQVLWLERICRRVTSFGRNSDSERTPLGKRSDWDIQYRELVEFLREKGVSESTNDFLKVHEAEQKKYAEIKRVALEKLKAKYKVLT